MKVVLVSELNELAKTISLFLKIRWREMTLISSSEAREVMELIYREHPDIIMLDHGAASVDCFDLISQIRGFSDVAIIVLSQSNDAVDKVRALEMGADDWLARDCMPMEFIARVSAILRRCSHNNHRVSHFLDGKLTINYATRQVLVSGKKTKLTPIEYKILCHLVESQGSIVSSRELLCHVWGPNYESDKELLKISIWRLRQKIEEDPANPQIVLSERGIGYIIRPSNSS